MSARDDYPSSSKRGDNIGYLPYPYYDLAMDEIDRLRSKVADLLPWSEALGAKNRSDRGNL